MEDIRKESGQALSSSVPSKLCLLLSKSAKVILNHSLWLPRTKTVGLLSISIRNGFSWTQSFNSSFPPCYSRLKEVLWHSNVIRIWKKSRFTSKKGNSLTQHLTFLSRSVLSGQRALGQTAMQSSPRSLETYMLQSNFHYLHSCDPE